MPLNEKNLKDYIYQENPVCPYCDFVLDINEFELFHLYEEGEHQEDCQCGKSITIQTNCKYTFNTEELDEE